MYTCTSSILTGSSETLAASMGLCAPVAKVRACCNAASDSYSAPRRLAPAPIQAIGLHALGEWPDVPVQDACRAKPLPYPSIPEVAGSSTVHQQSIILVKISPHVR